MPRDLFGPCNTLGPGIHNWLFAFFAVLHVPAHQLRPTRWRDDWTVARADGVVCIVGQQLQGLHIAEKIAYRGRRSAQHTVAGEQDTVSLEIEGHMVHFVPWGEESLQRHIPPGAD